MASSSPPPVSGHPSAQPADHGAGKRSRELCTDIGQETIKLRLDDVVALARPRLQTRAIEHCDPASLVTYQPGVLQLPGGFGDAFTAHAEHVGNQFLCHGEFVRCQTIQAQQQLLAQLLVDRMVPIADRRLRHLGDRRLGVAQQRVHRRTETLELVRDQFGLRRKLYPALCTTARLGLVSPPMNSDMPGIPSLPTMAISADAPFSMTYSSERMDVVGK
jgi:hypothetical protein